MTERDKQKAAATAALVKELLPSDVPPNVQAHLAKRIEGACCLFPKCRDGQRGELARLACDAYKLARRQERGLFDE